MKRVFMGIVWFIAFWIVLTIVFMIVIGVVVTSTSSGNPTTYEEGVQAGQAFAQAHALGLNLTRLGILLASIAAAAYGSWKGMLPGTKKSQA